MAKMGSFTVVVGFGLIGLAALACSGADPEAVDETAMGTLAQAAVVATLSDVSAAPVRTQVKVCRSGVGPSPRVVDCAVDPGFALVGGGARTIWSSWGAMLTQSQPLSDGFTWRARSVDHTVAEPHDLEVYAIGLRLDGVNARILRAMMGNASVAVPSDSVTSTAPGRIVSGGGSVTTTPLPGKMLTRTRYDPFGWSVAGRPLMQTTPPGVGMSMRLIPSGIVEGFGAIELLQSTGPGNSVTTGIGTSVGGAVTGYAIVAYGGEATTTSGAGRLLYGMGPHDGDVRRARADSKDHVWVSAGMTKLHFTLMRRAPGSHGLCNTGGKLAANMDSCVASICAVDPYCCNTRWDGVCLNRVQSVCGRSCADYTCSRPTFNPAFWTGGTKQQNNACYDYANNRVTANQPAIPGQNGAVEVMQGNRTVAAVTEAAEADGLMPIGETESCPDNRTKIALAIKPMPNPPVLGDADDYHWYRQDLNGRWSHKLGNSIPSDRDHDGAFITNPRLAARNKHTIFGGYFCTCSSATEGAGHARIGTAP